MVFFGAMVVIDTYTGFLCAGPLGGACRESRRCERPALAPELFFVAPNVWTKFSIRHPGVSYSEFLSYRAKCYKLRNESAKLFFAEFSKDPSRREAILRDRAARRVAKRSLTDPFVDEGVVPKPEPVEEGAIGPPEYVYLIPDASLDGATVAKTEPM
jgi:hypothetical protein